MKKVLYTNFDGIDSIIESMLGSKEMKKAITRNNLYKFWEKTVGAKFAKISFPYGMAPNNIMIISCKNAVVAQELLFKKQEILESIKPYAKSLQMKIVDLRFDPKKWVRENEE